MNLFIVLAGLASLYSFPTFAINREIPKNTDYSSESEEYMPEDLKQAIIKELYFQIIYLKAEKIKTEVKLENLRSDLNTISLFADRKSSLSPALPNMEEEYLELEIEYLEEELRYLNKEINVIFEAIRRAQSGLTRE